MSLDLHVVEHLPTRTTSRQCGHRRGPCGKIVGGQAGTQQPTDDAAGRRADDHLGGVRIPTEIVVQGQQRAGMVRGASCAARSEHETDAARCYREPLADAAVFEAARCAVRPVERVAVRAVRPVVVAARFAVVAVDRADFLAEVAVPLAPVDTARSVLAAPVLALRTVSCAPSTAVEAA